MKDKIKYLRESTIKALIRDRYAALKKGGELRLKADIIEDEIMKVFKKYSKEYPIDFIIETCTHFGACPSILYDDNGLFAVVCDGAQPVVMGKEKISGTMTFFPEKKQWKKSIREAVVYYLKH